jgi:hypothetical protein
VALLAKGWRPIHIWEHEPVGHAADRIELLWRDRAQGG